MNRNLTSTFRLRARGADEKLFLQRLVRVATHEIGHTLGLGHCPDDQCNMVDARGSILSVDQGSGKLCKTCQKRMQQ
ncbi:MAG: matrixin family metalloprotease [Akkermansiaceae bacterium]|nr:matrixin family metalloprotease [Akkermansiaceae bacterium]